MKVTDMHTDDVEIVVVSYNSSELIMDLLSSLRKHYSNTVYIIDGSDAHVYSSIEAVCNQFESVHFKHFDYNIHHGPGMAWAINNIQFKGPVLFLDSDIVVLKNGFIESMLQQLKPRMFGVGSIGYTNESGFDVDFYPGAIPYLHPACMLCNIDVMREWPLPIKHGAPMIETMYELHKHNKAGLLKNIPWLTQDFSKTTEKNYLQHDWQGTVKRAGGYNLEEWESKARLEASLRDLILSQMDQEAQQVVHIGCGNGSIARVYKEKNPSCQYIGIEEDALNGEMAKEFCDVTLVGAIESLNQNSLQLMRNSDLWVITKILNNIKDPNQLLKTVRNHMKPNSCLVICIENFQNWEVLLNLLAGKSDSHGSSLRNKQITILTRTSVLEMAEECRLQLVGGYKLASAASATNEINALITSSAEVLGTQPDIAIQDACASHFVFKFKPMDGRYFESGSGQDSKSIITF